MKRAIVMTPPGMSEETYQFICQQTRDKYPEERFTFRREVDEKLIGGFILNIEGKIYDVSLLGQLNLMREHLKK